MYPSIRDRRVKKDDERLKLKANLIWGCVNASRARWADNGPSMAVLQPQLSPSSVYFREIRHVDLDLSLLARYVCKAPVINNFSL